MTAAHGRKLVKASARQQSECCGATGELQEAKPFDPSQGGRDQADWDLGGGSKFWWAGVLGPPLMAGRKPVNFDLQKLLWKQYIRPMVNSHPPLRQILAEWFCHHTAAHEHQRLRDGGQLVGHLLCGHLQSESMSAIAHRSVSLTQCPAPDLQNERPAGLSVTLSGHGQQR